MGKIARLLFGAMAFAFLVLPASAQPADVNARVTVRYLVSDVAQSVAFYRDVLGFQVQNDGAPTLAQVRKGALDLVLVGPEATGARPVADGSKQTPGGWNRILLAVSDIDTEVARLKKSGVRVRTEILDGRAARQVLINDPSGNTVELVQFKSP